VDAIETGRNFIKNYGNYPFFILIFLFIIIVGIKFFISVQFNSPWLFRDEVVYFEWAQTIHQFNYVFIPVNFFNNFILGYPFLISPAFLFSPDKNTIYHLILALNSIITASVIFPSYYLLRKFCAGKISIIGALVITTLPSIFVYNFTIMSENLFIPLTVFSFWFIFKYYETFKFHWCILTILSVSLLLFTRALGIAMIIGLLCATFFYLLKCKKHEILRKRSENSTYLLIFSSIGLLIIYYGFSTFLANSVGYSTEGYSTSLIRTFTDFSSVYTVFQNIIHEIGFLVTASYVLFFVASLVFVIAIFQNSKNHYADCVEIYTDDNRVNALKIAIVYFISFSAGLMILTITHMYYLQTFLFKNTSQNFYSVFGRYVDPIIPVLFLIGIIGLHQLQIYLKDARIRRVILAGVPLILIALFFSLPVKNYAMGDTLSIWYIEFVSHFEFAFLVLLILFFIFTASPAFISPSKRYVILLVTIVISVLIITITIPAELTNSKDMEKQGAIGQYLGGLEDQNYNIIIDQADYQVDGGVFYWITKYWIKGNNFQVMAWPEFAGAGMNNSQNVTYLLTGKTIQKDPILCVSYNEYCLYKIDYPVETVGSRKEGWYGYESWNGIPTHWVSGDFTINVSTTKEHRSVLAFDAQSFRKARTLEISLQNDTITKEITPSEFTRVEVPLLIHQGENSIKFHVKEGCDQPKEIPEMNSQDSRCLSLLIQKMTIS
jgi:hypothetical protein